MNMIRKMAALLLALLMLAGICVAAEPQISAEGLAMMGVLDSKELEFVSAPAEEEETEETAETEEVAAETEAE